MYTVEFETIADSPCIEL